MWIHRRVRESGGVIQVWKFTLVPLVDDGGSLVHRVENGLHGIHLFQQVEIPVLPSLDDCSDNSSVDGHARGDQEPDVLTIEGTEGRRGNQEVEGGGDELCHFTCTQVEACEGVTIRVQLRRWCV